MINDPLYLSVYSGHSYSRVNYLQIDTNHFLYEIERANTTFEIIDTITIKF